jgi:hypothetical protein
LIAAIDVISICHLARFIWFHDRRSFVDRRECSKWSSNKAAAKREVRGVA